MTDYFISYYEGLGLVLFRVCDSLLKPVPLRAQVQINLEVAISPVCCWADSLWCMKAVACIMKIRHVITPSAVRK